MGDPEVKTEPEPEPETKQENLSANEENSDVCPSELEKKIITQIEYYFGNHNLANDKFLKGKIKEDDGWVPLSVMLTFNRLKSLTTEAPVVVKALRKATKNLIEISDDENKIRRNPELPLSVSGSWKDDEWSRTVYVKGFAVDSSMDMILEFFKNEGNTINIFMKKNFHSRAFKGSVFVTFETKEEAETFAKKEGQKYKSTVLIKEMRQDYQTRKQNEFLKRKEDREKRKLERQEKGEGGEEEPVDFNPDEDMKKDCLMKLTGFVEGTCREDIKDKLCPHGNVAYVDFKIGDTEAVIRFEESGVARDVFDKSKTGEEGEKKLVIKDAEITASFPEGDEEVEYWKKIVTARSNFVKTKRNHKRRGGFRGGRGDFRGRGRGFRGRGYDRSERRRSVSNDSDQNGNTPASDRKRSVSASNEEVPPAKTEKMDSPLPDRKRQAVQEVEGEPPAKLEKADS